MREALAEGGHQKTASEIDDLWTGGGRPLESIVIEGCDDPANNRDRAVVTGSVDAAPDGPPSDENWGGGRRFVHVVVSFNFLKPYGCPESNQLRAGCLPDTITRS